MLYTDFDKIKGVRIVQYKNVDKLSETKAKRLDEIEKARMMSVGVTGTGRTYATKDLAHRMSLQLAYTE